MPSAPVSAHTPQITLSQLKRPTCYIFRGFVAESACGEESSDLFYCGASVPTRMFASAGFVRSVDYRMSGRQTGFGVRPARSDEGEEPGALNGIIQACRVSADDVLEARMWLDLPLGKYVSLVSRPRSDFEALTWLDLPNDCTTVYVQCCNPKRYKLPSLKMPLLQTYVDQQLVRAKNIGDNFAKEFVSTTRNWPKFWLNEREVPRRPWVHSKEASFIDGVLRNYPPAPHNAFAHRCLDSEYAVLIHAEQTRAGDGDVTAAPRQQRNRDWSGEKLPSSTCRHFMFGFGSLMNTGVCERE